jgi:Rrf2 family nitric oxide-sensitive transcriptional repressor
MRLTVMTDYALRLLMYLGGHTDRLCTIAEIADAHGISEAHLMKVTHRLATLGLIETLRGKGGGMRLPRPASEINLGAVVRAIEPDFQLVECFGNAGACVLTRRCGVTGVLDGALREFMAHLDRHTLADVLPPSRTSPASRSHAMVRV